MKTKSLLALGIIVIMHLSVKAQVKIGNNPTSINSNSLLELESSNQGFVLPRVSIGDVSSYSPMLSNPLTGTIVYNNSSTTTGGSGTGIYLWDGTKWVFISTGTAVSSSAWLLTGNSGLSSSTNFIGTTDAIDFVVRTTNTERMRILGAANGSSKAGWIGMGVTVPRSSLDVTGHYTNKNVVTIENSSTSGYSSVDMLDSAGNLAGTFGYANLGTSGSFSGKDYFNGYGNDFLFTRGSSSDLIMKGNSGYIGLNTSTPSERLHVVGNIYLNGAFMPGGTAGTTGNILTSAGAGVSPTWTSPNGLAWILTGNSGTSYATNFLGTTDNVSMRFRTNNVQRMIIDSLGKVGIGINNPAYALSVSSASNPLYLSGVQSTSTFSTDSLLTINNGVVKKTSYATLLSIILTGGNPGWLLTGNSGTIAGLNYIGTSDAVDFVTKTNNTERMRITSNGLVGIGTSNPSYALSVLSASNPLYLSGVQATSTLSTDSVLTISNGVVKKTPSSSVSNNSWNLLGNSATNSAINFLGTTDNHPLKLRVNNTIAGYIDSSGGLGNAYFGSNAGYSNTTGSGNTFVGAGADSANNSGTSNTALGYQTGYSNTSGGSNTFTGYQNGFSNTTGSGNLFGGFQAGYRNTTGQVNVFSGYWTGYSNTTGSNNVFSGYLSGFGNTTGNNNLFIGSQAGSTNTTGSKNTLIGANSNVLSAGLTNAAAIGYNAKVALSNSLVLGDTISGGGAVNVGIGVRNPLKRLHIDAAPISITAVGTQDSLKIDNLATSSSAYRKAILVIDSTTGYVSKQSLANLTSNLNWSLTGNSGTNYATNFLGTTDNVSLRLRTNNTERMIIDSLGSVGIGSSAFDPIDKEKLLVDYGTSATNTVATFKGSVDDYFQINLQNKSGTANASTDYVATADDGTDSTYYIDMGINSSNYAFSIDNWGNAHDAYLYSNSKNLYIGTQASSSDVVFLVGGGRAVTNAALRIKGSNGNIVVGKGEASSTPVGNTLRGPSGYGTNIAGGSLTIQGGASTGNATAGTLYLSGGIVTGLVSNSTVNNAPIVMNTSATERMRIDSAGNVGIGIANPSYKLSVLAGTNPLYLSGVQATSTFNSDSILTINAGVVKKAAYSALSSSTTNTLTLTGNTLTSTVNGIAATSNAVSSVSNTSNANTLSTTINGVTGTTVPIINTNTNALSQAGGLVTTVNGIAATTSIAGGTVSNVLGYNSSGIAVYQSLSNLNLSTAWNITGNTGTSYLTNFLGTTDNVSMRFRTNNIQRMIIDSLGKVGIGTSSPSSDLTLYQSSGSGNAKGFTFTGNSISGNNSGTGFLMSLGYNTSGNKQLWLGDADYAGNAAGSFARFVTTGTVFPVIDAVSGDNAVRRYLAFGVAGDANSGVIFGGDNTSVNPGSQVWDNGNMSIGSSYKSYAAPSNGLLVQGNVGIGTASPTSALSVLAASNPLYLSGVQATSTFSTDSILTINAGVVKKAPYSSLPSGVSGSGWALTGNSISAGQFLGTTNALALVLKSNNTQMGYFDGNVSSLALGVGAVNNSSDHNVAIGYNASTNNQYALALGYNATASGVRSVAIGNGAAATTASGSEAVAIGYNATSSGVQSTAIGYTSSATSSYALAMGYGAQATTSSDVIAIGHSATASAQYATAIGYGAQATGLQSTAIGYNAQTSQSNTILLGNAASSNLYVGIGTATPTAKLHIVGGTTTNYPLQMTGLPTGTAGTDNILTINASGVVGYVTPANFNSNYWGLNGNAAASGNFLGTTNTTPLQFKFNSTAAGYLDANNTAFGTSSVSTSGTNNTAIGYSANAANGSTAIGASSVTTAANNTAVGNSATANNSTNETAIGASAQATAQYNTAVGYNAQAISNSQATAIGTTAKANAIASTALGYNAQAISNGQTTALGVNSQANAQYGTAVGYNAQSVSNSYGTAVGTNSNTTGQYATAIGSETDATFQYSTALGYNAQATVNNQTTAVGANTSATGTNSTAIGYGATTSQTNAIVVGTSTNNVGIGTSTPNTNAKLDVAGNFKMGTAGTVLSSMIKSTFTVSPIVALGTTTTYTATVTGANAGASVIVNPRSTLANGVVIAYSYISSANTITIAFTSGSTIGALGTLTFDVTVIQ